MSLDFVEIVAVHEDAALRRVAVDVDVQEQSGRFGIPRRRLDVDRALVLTVVNNVVV